MKQSLSHGQIAQMVTGLFDSGVVDGDVPIRRLVSAQADSLVGGATDDLSLHVLCCNEYFLVTEIVEQPVEISDSAAASVRGDLA